MWFPRLVMWLLNFAGGLALFGAVLALFASNNGLQAATLGAAGGLALFGGAVLWALIDIGETLTGHPRSTRSS